MKKSRFTDSQIMAILKQAEGGVTVAELCREHSISSASFYKWRAKYGGMDASLMKRMKELEAETPGSRECTPKSGSRPSCAKRLLRESCKAISTPGDGP